jgi:hypothetical protein
MLISPQATLPVDNSLKLSQLASIRNGEIPVVLVYFADDAPKDYRLASPEEAASFLAMVEYIRDVTQSQKKPNHNHEKGGDIHDE